MVAFAHTKTTIKEESRLGTRRIDVEESVIVRHTNLPPFISFRPDVILVGDLITDARYTVVMVETDGVMTITANKNKRRK
jgi:hypothetical protein